MNTNNTEIAVSAPWRRLLTSDFRTQEGAERFVATCSRRFPDDKVEAVKSPIPGTWMVVLVQTGVVAYRVASFNAEQDRRLEVLQTFTAGYCAGLLDALQYTRA